jgi:uncharacterized protein YndB with AHSA1/START domain
MSNESSPSQTPTSDRETVITRDFNAPRELVWAVFTDPKHIAQWWGPRGFTLTTEILDLRVGGEWRQVMQGPDGTKYPGYCTFQEVVKPERIVYSIHNGKEIAFVATWTFEALTESETRVTGRNVFPTAAALEMVVKNFGVIEKGKEHLACLSEYLSTQQTEPFIISREFDAPRELVWKAWTERASLMKWFGPKEQNVTHADLDFRPGGQFHYCMSTPDGHESWGKSVYLEIDPPKRILWLNSFADKDGNTIYPPFPGPKWPLEMLSEATFSEHDGKTTVTIRWFPHNSSGEERKTFDDNRSGMTQGWTGSFDRLASFLAASVDVEAKCP